MGLAESRAQSSPLAPLPSNHQEHTAGAVRGQGRDEFPESLLQSWTLPWFLWSSGNRQRCKESVILSRGEPFHLGMCRDNLSSQPSLNYSRVRTTGLLELWPPHCSLISAYLPLEKQAVTVRSQPRCAGTFAEGHGPHSQDVRSETQCLVWEGGIADCFLACADGQQGTGVAGQAELGPEAWHCLLGWTVRPGLGRLVQAGVGAGLGAQAVVAVAAAAAAAAGSQTEAAGVLMMAAGGAGGAAVEHKLQGEKPG